MSESKTVPETKNVKEYVYSICSNLESIHRSWMFVAFEFSMARKFLKKKDFMNVYRQTRFSYSTVCKLIKIAGSERLKDHEKELSHIDSWSTLHEIVKLDEKQFAAFKKQYLTKGKGRYIERADVEEFNEARASSKRSDFDVLATVKVNLKGFDSRDELKPIQSALDKLNASFSDNANIKVKVVNVSKKLKEKEVVELKRAA